MHSEIEIFSDDQQQFSDGSRIKSSLLIMNATIHDSGTSFDCIADNGIGKPSKSTTTLLVLHKPVIDRSPLISKSASESGSSSRLICRAQGTPNVTFTWKRDASVIESEMDPLFSLMDAGGGSDGHYKSASYASSKHSSNDKLPKYVIEKTIKLDLITYQSVLIINDITSSDYGQYECVAQNDLGFDALFIGLNRTSKPDPPRSLRIVNVTSGSVTIRWVPGFDGGLDQSFRVRYRPFDSLDSSDNVDPLTMYRDVYPPNATTVTIGGLRDNTDYIFSVMASNIKGSSEFSEDSIQTKTLKESGITETEKIISKVLAESGFDVPRLFVLICVICFALLLFNFVVVFYLRARKKRKRYEEESDAYSGGTDSKTTTSSKTTMELYDTNTNGTKPSTMSLNHCGLNGQGLNGKVINNETSMSDGDDEMMSNKSDDRFSGQTDYEMEMPPSHAMITALDHETIQLQNALLAQQQQQHHHQKLSTNGFQFPSNILAGIGLTSVGGGGMSTYLIEEPNDDETDQIDSNHNYHHHHNHHHHHHNHNHNQIDQINQLDFLQSQAFSSDHNLLLSSPLPPPPPPTTTTTTTTSSINYSSLRYSSLGSDIAPATFYNAIATEEDYLSVLKHSQSNRTLMTPIGQIGTINTINGPMQIQLNGSIEDGVIGSQNATITYGTINPLDLHHDPTAASATATTFHLIGPDATILSSANVDDGGQTSSPMNGVIHQQQSKGHVQPLPPLRSLLPATTATNGSMTTFLPAITEEPPITPIGHLV
ncbi:Nephrin [Sarcoptes scabiei]|uniref:Nephrin n=1 Tax=Sarcoptes scabiei TaxID=52283 RepID=A0A834R592_SARSC|nr:Nephrin [Sarcoptes scabiei]